VATIVQMQSNVEDVGSSFYRGMQGVLASNHGTVYIGF
jgi:hypothetical protein